MLSLLTIIKYSDAEEPDKKLIKTTVIGASFNLGKVVVRLYVRELFKKQDKFGSLSTYTDNLKQNKG